MKGEIHMIESPPRLYKHHSAGFCCTLISLWNCFALNQKNRTNPPLWLNLKTSIFVNRGGRDALELSERAHKSLQKP